MGGYVGGDCPGVFREAAEQTIYIGSNVCVMLAQHYVWIKPELQVPHFHEQTLHPFL